MKSLKISYIFSALKSVVVILFPIISFPYASRILGVSNIGKVTYCTSVISYFTLFASLGISAYATREGAKVKDNQYKLNKLSREIFLINLISTGIVYTVFLILLFLNTFNGYFIVMLICSLAIWFTTLSIEWLYQIEEDFTYISIRSMIFQIISLVLLFVLVKEKDDYIGYAIIQVFASGGSCILNLINAKKYVDFFAKTDLEIIKHIKPILTIFGVSAASSIYVNLDTVMLGIIHSDYEVGIYTAAVKIVSVIKQIISSLSMVAVSRLTSYLCSKNDEKYESLLKYNFDMNISLVVPCAIGMIMLSKYIILFFSGAEYLSATNASVILALNSIFSVIDGMIYVQIMIPNQMDFQSFIGTCFGAVSNIILNALLIPFFSVDGAAIATLISEFCVFCSFLYFLRNIVNFKKLLSEFPRCLCASISIIIVCVLSMQFISNIIIMFLMSISLSVVMYFIVLRLLKGPLAIEIFDTFFKILNVRRGK